MNLLEVSNLVKSFDGVPVLSSISFSLPEGRILGLVGENGAGKSTLVKCIAGIHHRDSGTIHLEGSCCTIPQEFTLIPELTVWENLFLGRELTCGGFLRKGEMRRKQQEIFKRLHSTVNPDAFAGTLSVAEKQMVEIAKAFLNDSNVLIMDEPTTVLNHREVDILFGIMREFIQRGGSIIYISHKLDEVREICHQIAVLRDGVLVAEKDAKQVSSRELAELMVGRELNQIFPEKQQLPADAPDVLTVCRLSSGKAVKQVSFSLKKGEILGLAGLAGSGRTELAETICALRRRSAGQIYLDGKECHFRYPADALKAGIAYLPEDRQGTAILTDFSVAANTTLSSLKRYCTQHFIREKQCADAAWRYARQFETKMQTTDDKLLHLSGGNQQKVAIAKGLDTNPGVFIFDEPTRGVDVGARGDIYRLIHDLAQQGISCLLISSDLEEVIGNCSRVLVMREGSLAGEVCNEQVTEQEIMYLATGVVKK